MKIASPPGVAPTPKQMMRQVNPAADPGKPGLLPATSITRLLASAAFGIAAVLAVVPARAEFDAAVAMFGMSNETKSARESSGVATFHAYVRSGKIYLTTLYAYDQDGGLGIVVAIPQSGGEDCRGGPVTSYGTVRRGRQCYRVTRTGPDRWAISADVKLTDAAGVTDHTTIDFNLALIKARPRSRCSVTDVKGEQITSSRLRSPIGRATYGAQTHSECSLFEWATKQAIAEHDRKFMQ